MSLPVQCITATAIAIWVTGNTQPDRHEREKGMTWQLSAEGILVTGNDRVYLYPWFSVTKVGFDV